jgi:DNA modification methylase
MRENRDISTLHNWKDNPRAIKKDKFEELKKRISKRGQIKPLIITPDGEVLGGNMRLRAMQELGIKEAWVSVVEPTSEADKIEIALTDNEEMGYYEDQALAELIAQYKDEIDLSKYSVHLKPAQTLEEILKQFSLDKVIEDEAPEVAEEAVSELGKVYQLGRHRVMCGDSTKIEDVEKLMDGKKADMVFTDPPYGVDYEGIKNDDKEGLEQLLRDVFTNYVVMSKSGASAYVFHSDRNADIFHKVFREFFHFSSMIVWEKNSLVLSQTDYQSQHEPCMYGWFSNGTHSFYGDRKQTSIWKCDHEPKIIGHTTPKPVAIVSRAINNSSKSDDIIIDLFLGSGSTLIACEQTNRTCYGSELDPKYIDVIIKRWMKFTGKRAYKIIDEDGNLCREIVKFADESFMELKTIQEDSEAKT